MDTLNESALIKFRSIKIKSGGTGLYRQPPCFYALYLHKWSIDGQGGHRVAR